MSGSHISLGDNFLYVLLTKEEPSYVCSLNYFSVCFMFFPTVYTSKSLFPFVPNLIFLQAAKMSLITFLTPGHPDWKLLLNIPPLVPSSLYTSKTFVINLYQFEGNTFECIESTGETAEVGQCSLWFLKS